MLADTLHNWITVAAGLLGVAGIIGAAFAVISSNYSTKTIQNLKEFIDSKEEIEKLLRTERVELIGRIVALEAQVKTLQDQVKNPPQLTALTEKVVLYHKEVSEALVSLTRLLTPNGHARSDQS